MQFGAGRRAPRNLQPRGLLQGPHVPDQQQAKAALRQPVGEGIDGLDRYLRTDASRVSDGDGYGFHFHAVLSLDDQELVRPEEGGTAAIRWNSTLRH